MILKVSGIDLYYEKCGQGRAVIMLHGNGEDHHIFDEARKKLKEHFTVYVIDTRGHGKSSPVSELHYMDIADDIYQFITQLKIEKPILYGFSDGGIVGLLLAVYYPDLLSQLIVSGVNTNPNGMKFGWLRLFKLIYFVTRSPKYKLMITEPDITKEMLQRITIPVHMTVGSKDMISFSHTKSILNNITGASLKVFDNENHGSYIINSTKLADHMIQLLIE